VARVVRWFALWEREALVSLGLAGALYGARSGAFPSGAALPLLLLLLLLLLLQINGAIIIVLLLLVLTEPAMAVLMLALCGATVVVKLKGHRGHRHHGHHG
jgi:uncharacterized membrane protein